MSEEVGTATAAGRAPRRTVATRQTADPRAPLDSGPLTRTDGQLATPELATKELATPEPATKELAAPELAASSSHLMVAPARSWFYERSKRLIDVLVGSILLLLSTPLMAVVWIAIKVDSRGPALFRQERIGRYGQPFELVKFRTMYVDAAARFPELYRYDYRPDELDDMYFKYPHDPRCTRVGRWIRRTSLDELPNLLNVVRGDISLVGPRPEIFPMLPFYRPDQLCKFGVKPGMTGLAQVSGRNILRWQETNQRDVEYVKRRSLRLDLTILARTLWAVVGMVGAL